MGIASRSFRPKTVTLQSNKNCVRSAYANRSSEENESSKRELTSTRHTFRQVENSAWETEAHNVGTLVRRLSEAPRREIKCLVGKLMTLHKKLETDGDRIQLDIEEYAELNQHVMQLTTIIADSVGNSLLHTSVDIGIELANGAAVAPFSTWSGGRALCGRHGEDYARRGRQGRDGCARQGALPRRNPKPKTVV